MHAVQVWSPYTVAYIKKIEKVQMRATKQMTCIYHPVEVDYPD